METRNHKRSAEHKVKSERAPGLNNPQGVEIPMSDTTADLHDIWLFLGMNDRRMQALWDLCQGENRRFYRQKVAELADITRTMRRHTNGRAS